MNVIQAMLLTLLMALCSNGCAPDREPDAAMRTASAAAADDDVCTIVERGLPLPDAARETSGLAAASHDGALLWTHNDAGNEPVLFAIAPDGSLAGSVRVTGARLEDWEDIEAGACASGRCLYIGDIGDNDSAREFITIYEIDEPAEGARATEAARVMSAVYPDGPHNAEALFILPSGDLYVVTKGDPDATDLYRYPAAARGSARATLERIGGALALRRTADERVTGATASPDGRWVAIRTYRTLYFFRAEALVSGAVQEPITFDLAPLGEAQGEGVVLAADGTVWLSSEAEDEGSPRRARLECVLPE